MTVDSGRARARPRERSSREQSVRGDRRRLTLRDIVCAEALDAHKIAEAIREGGRVLPPDTNLADAAAYMGRQGIQHVLVVEDGKFFGVLTPLDVMRAVPQVAPSHDRPEHWVPGAGELPSAFPFPWLP